MNTNIIPLQDLANEIYDDLFEGYTIRFTNGTAVCKAERFRDLETDDEVFYATFNVKGQHASRTARFAGEGAFESMMNVLICNGYQYLKL